MPGWLQLFVGVGAWASTRTQSWGLPLCSDIIDWMSYVMPCCGCGCSACLFKQLAVARPACPLLLCLMASQRLPKRLFSLLFCCCCWHLDVRLLLVCACCPNASGVEDVKLPGSWAAGLHDDDDVWSTQYIAGDPTSCRFLQLSLPV